MTSTWVLIPCPRHRLDELRTLLSELEHDSTRVVIVTTEPDPIMGTDIVDLAQHLLVFEKPGMWFSAWVNLGLDYIALQAAGAQHEVLVVGSDAHGNKASTAVLRNAMRGYDLAMCGPDWRQSAPTDRTVDILNGHNRTVYDRVPGSCFMLAGEDGLRMNEAYRWWYSEDWLEVTIRRRRLVGLAQGTGLTHTTDHELNAEQAEHAIEDRQRFVDEFGHEPW